MTDLELMWDEFEEDVERFEENYRQRLISKLGKTQDKMDKEEKFKFEKKIESAVQRKFGTESKKLVEKHLSSCLLSNG